MLEWLLGLGHLPSVWNVSIEAASSKVPWRLHRAEQPHVIHHGVMAFLESCSGSAVSLWRGHMGGTFSFTTSHPPPLFTNSWTPPPISPISRRCPGRRMASFMTHCLFIKCLLHPLWWTHCKSKLHASQARWPSLEMYGAEPGESERAVGVVGGTGRGQPGTAINEL